MYREIDKMNLVENKLKMNKFEYETERIISIIGIIEFEIKNKKELIKINGILFRMFGYIVDKKVVTDIPDSIFIYTSNGYCLAKHKNDIADNNIA